MADTKIQRMHSNLNRLLDEYKLADAIEVALAMADESADHRQRDKISALSDTYGYMMHYLIEGVSDSTREYNYRDIVSRLRQSADMMLRADRMKASPDIFSSTLRFQNLRNEDFSSLLHKYSSLVAESTLMKMIDESDPSNEKSKEEILESLFNIVFTSLNDKEMVSSAGYAVTSEMYDNSLSAQLVSALTLSLLVYFDKYKVSALIDIYESDTISEIRARAFVGIVLAIAAHPDRLREETSLMARLSAWKDSDETYSNLKNCTRAIIGTRDTDRIATKMKEEVIPELMKLRPEIMKRMGENLQDADPSLLEDNPEWQEMLDKSGIQKKLEELSELQNDGADLMMVTFSNLKNFPFFRQANNWFLPFNINNTAISLSDSLRDIVESLIPLSKMICDSDKYSLALALGRMPEAQSRLIGDQFKAQIEQIGEEMKDREIKVARPEFSDNMLKAVRDLYRFFTLFHNREGIRNPFAKPIDFVNLPVIGEILSEKEPLTLIGEFYFKRGYYKEALPILLLLSEMDGSNAQIWEKIGFCHQSGGDLRSALSAYEKSEILKTPGPWLLKKLAGVNRRLGNKEKAAEYYERLLETDPENVANLMNAGHLMLEMDDLSGALTHYYHANYLVPDNKKIMRAVAWVELLSGNLDKSESYYARLTEDSPIAADWINAGHCAMVRGNFKEARSRYIMAVDNNFVEFSMTFYADIPTLEKLGVDPLTANMMLDCVRRVSGRN